METAGLAVGVASLAGLFNNAVDCFEYVQLGRNFGTDFQTSLLKLDTLRLRLTRWGQAVGIANAAETQTLQQTRLAAQDVEMVGDLLGQIQVLFEEAEGHSYQFSKRARSAQSLALYSPTQDLDRASASLHRKMRDLAIKRQSQVGLRQKTKWALYEGKRFSRLIEDIDDLVSKLVELFPGLEKTQQQLCETEVSEMDASSLPRLREVAADQDTTLNEVISKVIMSSSRQSRSITFEGNNNKGLIVAENMGTISGQSWSVVNEK